jgi:hypothetical protein
MGCPALLQVADHADTDARGISELPLGEPGSAAVTPYPAAGEFAAARTFGTHHGSPQHPHGPPT